MPRITTVNLLLWRICVSLDDGVDRMNRDIDDGSASPDYKLLEAGWHTHASLNIKGSGCFFLRLPHQAITNPDWLSIKPFWTKFDTNLNNYEYIFFQENAFQNVVWKMESPTL